MLRGAAGRKAFASTNGRLVTITLITYVHCPVGHVLVI